MAKNGIEQIVERVVSQLLDSHVENLRKELVRKVSAELPSTSESAQGRGFSTGADTLLQAVSAIQASTGQRDVLRALLDNCVPFCGRIALFVVKGGTVTAWQGRSFPESIKDFAMASGSALVAKVLKSHRAAHGNASEVDHDFISEFGAPVGEQCVLLPLVLKEKVAALVYADAGTQHDGRLDAAALELLVISTGHWLELASLRKPSAREGTHESAAEVPMARAAAAHAGPAVSDPFAAHAPAFAQPNAAGTAAREPEEVAVSSPDAEIHKKAQRFARLLVDEIKLYNQAKLIEGRQKKDLYDRLKEDIDKSRSTYQKRYGSTPAAEGDYFTQELIRSLAEDDVSLLGSNFSR
jgi:hypothetical protein